MDLGSVTNVMEEPAVELPLLTDPAASRKLQASSLTSESKIGIG